MTLPELSAYVASQGLGTVGVDVFENFMPPKPDACISLHEYGGRTDPNVRAFGEAQMSREFARVQARVRGVPENYDTPRLKAQSLLLALSRLMGVTLSSVEYFTSTPMQTVFLLDKDELNRYVFAVNFEFFKQVSTS